MTPKATALLMKLMRAMPRNADLIELSEKLSRDAETVSRNKRHGMSTEELMSRDFKKERSSCPECERRRRLDAERQRRRRAG